MKRITGKRTTGLLVFGTLILPALFVACSTTKAYKGASRPSSEVALVKGFGVTLVRVNGVSIGVASSGVEVLPGKNEVEFEVDASNYNSSTDDLNKVFKLIMNAKAGKKYAVTSQRGDGRTCAWEIDPATGMPGFRKSAGCEVRN